MIKTVSIEQKYKNYRFKIGDKLELIEDIGITENPTTPEVIVFSHKHNRQFKMSKVGFEWMTV